jgi:membrane protease subunit (stomatin/prohibitin family)
MSLRDFLSKQFIDVIEWVEPDEGILAYRYPMQDREIQNGGSSPFVIRRWPSS